MKKISVIALLLLSFQAIRAQVPDPVLKNLIDKAYEKSSAVKINGYKIRQTEIDRRTAKQTYLPRVGFSTTYTRLNDDILFPSDLQTLLLGTQRLLIKEKVGLGFNSQLPASIQLKEVPPIQEKNIFKVTANSQMIVFSGLKVPLAIKASHHQENILRISNEKERVQVIADVVTTYDQLSLVLASEKVLASSEDLLNEQKRFVENAIRNGLATPLERQKIELAQERLHVKQVEFTSNKNTLIEKLHQLTGLPVEQLLTIHPVLQPMLIEADSLKEAERPETKMLNEAIIATEYKRKMELTDYLPKVAVFGQYEFRKQDLSMLDPRWYAGVRLQWSIFDGFTAKNNAEKSSIDKQVYMEQQQQINELYNLAVTKSTLEWKTANQKISMAQQQVLLANKMLDFVSKQYQNGLTTLTELLNALNDKEKAGLDLQSAFFEQRKASIAVLQYKGILPQYF